MIKKLDLYNEDGTLKHQNEMKTIHDKLNEVIAVVNGEEVSVKTPEQPTPADVPNALPSQTVEEVKPAETAGVSTEGTATAPAPEEVKPAE